MNQFIHLHRQKSYYFIMKNQNIACLLLIPSFLLYPLGNNYSYYDESSHHQKL